MSLHCKRSFYITSSLTRDDTLIGVRAQKTSMACGKSRRTTPRTGARRPLGVPPKRFCGASIRRPGCTGSGDSRQRDFGQGSRQARDSFGFLVWTEDNLLRQVAYQGQRKDKPAQQVVRATPRSLAR